jgi:hypothetical protein
MITELITTLRAEPGMVLTNGKEFTHSVMLAQGQEPSDWSEISETEFQRLMAKMTPREFILKLMEKGITREQLEALINSNDRVWAELNYATEINRANPLLDQLCGQFGLTSSDVDELFGV